MTSFKTYVVVLSVMCAMASTVRAGEWPEQPIKLIMPFPAGGPSDALARAVANKMEPARGTSIVVENLGGAGGSIGMQKLARSAPDGYTIGFGTIGTHAANMIVYRKPLYSSFGRWGMWALSFQKEVKTRQKIWRIWLTPRFVD